MKRAIAFFVFALAFGIYAPLGAQADEGGTAFTSFTLNGEEEDAEISPDTPEVEIVVSAPEEAHFTRLYICPESADPCDGSSAIKFFSPNATTTSFTRSWEGLATSDEAVPPGVYHLTVRFFRYDIQPDAFEETAPYTVTVLSGDDEEEEDNNNPPSDILGGDIICCFIDSDLSVTIGGNEYQGPEGLFDEIITFQPPLVIDGSTLENPSQTITILFREREDEEEPGRIRTVFDHPVPLERGAYVLHRLVDDPTPENGPEGDTLFPGVNFSLVHGAIPANDGDPGTVESVTITFSDLPAFGDPSALSGTYHLSVYEYPETKFIYDPEANTFTEEPYTDADFLRYYEWLFASDEYTGDYPELHSPDNEASLTIDEYIAAPGPVYQECCSSVVFLPGIKGSRLYVEGENGEDKLWEPGNPLETQGDIARLLLDETGSSTHAVYVRKGDVLDNAGGRKYYDSLVADMNTLVSDETIAAFEAVAYDWRLSIDDIVNQGAEIDGKIYYSNATSTPYIEQTLRRLAQHSQTGKVTIVAHSNGGLVAKALMNRLGEDAVALIDDMVFVGAPQSGAPQAVGALLYGHKENISLAFLSKATARELGENSPMGYHLLPSQQYFDDVKDINHPVGLFSAATHYQKERDAYGFLITNWEELAAFLRADEGGRTKPLASDIHDANVLNSTLLSYAKQTHDTLDSWTPPTGITLHQIAGWGVDTIAGIEFYDLYAPGAGTSIPYYKPIIVEDGDGVVPVPSALMISTSTENVKRWWVNFSSLSGSEREKEHGDFLEISDLRIFIKNIIENSSEFPASILANQPSPNELSKKLRFFLHSPLTLTILDENGNTVGEYDEFGDVKYVTVPQGATYTLSLTGLDTGTFTLEIEELENGTAVASSTLANIPVLEGTTATLTISNGISNASSLSVDVDGDGEEDIALTPQAGETVFYQESTTETEEQSAPIPGGGGPLWSASTPAPQVLGASTSTSSTTIQASIETLPLLSSTTTINNQQEQIIENVTPLGHTPEPQVSVERTNTPSTLPSTTAQAASAISAASQQSWFTEIVSVVYAWIRTTTKVLFSLFEHL